MNMKMLSENIKTGDIVEIKNAYFKNDNGLYFVINSKGDVNWCGDDYCLKKICKNGKLSTAKYNICFWPLRSFTNSREKRIEAKRWNEENATIEKVANIDNSYVIEYFRQKAEDLKPQEKRAIWDWGEDAEATKLITNTIAFYNSVADRLTVSTKPQQETAEAVIENIHEEKATPEYQSPEAVKIIVTYSTINEAAARRAKEMNSFSDYILGSATKAYQNKVDEVAEIAQNVADKNPGKFAELQSLVDRYAVKLAEWYNKYYSIECRCPSIMISGGGNFPIRKKEKQNLAREAHQAEYSKVEYIVDKIKGINSTSNIIKSDDENAIEKLEKKLESLEKQREEIKAYNKKARTENKEQLPAYILQNLSQNIRTTKLRLDELKKAKSEVTEDKTDKYNTSVCRVVENTEAMRIQLIFEDKPNEEIRSILKSNGFRWSPTYSAWQRHLNNNGKYATKKVLEKLKKLTS